MGRLGTTCSAALDAGARHTACRHPHPGVTVKDAHHDGMTAITETVTVAAAAWAAGLPATETPHDVGRDRAGTCTRTPGIRMMGVRACPLFGGASAALACCGPSRAGVRWAWLRPSRCVVPGFEGRTRGVWQETVRHGRLRYTLRRGTVAL